MCDAFSIQLADASHGSQMIALLPELANFDIPERRKPDHLWHGDKEMIQEWMDGNRPESFCCVALSDEGEVAGLSFVTLREELLSHEPSAHLEVLVVSPKWRRHGLGERLSEAAEVEAKKRGAESITLHVFRKNERARALYKKLGYDEELLRCSKPL